MNKAEFLGYLKSKGTITNATEAQAALDKWRSAGNTFDDDTVSTNNDDILSQSKRQNPIVSSFKEYPSRVDKDIQDIAVSSIKSQNRDKSKFNEVLSNIAGAAKSTSSIISNLPGIYEATNAIGKGFVKAMPGTAEALGWAIKQGERLPEPVKNLSSIGMSVLDVLPSSGIASKVGSKGIVGVTKEVGGGLGNVGKWQLGTQANISKKLAKKAAETPEAGVNKIISDIVDYKLESPVGGFSGISKKAQSRIAIEKSKANKLIEDFSKSNPNDKINIDETITSFADDLEKGKYSSIFTTEDRASEIAKQIQNSLQKRGLTGDQPISKIPEIKRVIDEGMDLYKNGAYAVDVDPLRPKVGELYYDVLKKKLEEKIPDIKGPNKAIHDLINVQDAMNESSYAAKNSKTLKLKLPLVQMLLPDFTGNARRASLLIKSGRSLKDLSEGLSKKVSINPSVNTPVNKGISNINPTIINGDKNYDNLLESTLKNLNEMRDTPIKKSKLTSNEVKNLEEINVNNLYNKSTSEMTPDEIEYINNLYNKSTSEMTDDELEYLLNSFLIEDEDAVKESLRLLKEEQDIKKPSNKKTTKKVNKKSKNPPKNLSDMGDD